MFEQTITLFKKIFNKETRQDEYIAQIINNVLYDSISSISTIKNGVEAKFTATVVIPNVSLDIKEGDYIAPGEQTDYRKGNIVKGVDYKKFGSLDHIEVLL